MKVALRYKLLALLNMLRLVTLFILLLFTAETLASISCGANKHPNEIFG